MSAQRDQAAAMLRAGLQPIEVAKRLGLNHNTVRGWASKLGISAERRQRVRAIRPPARPAHGETHFVIPDTQAKPCCSVAHFRAIGRYIADREPDIVIHLGDHWDFPSLSSYEKPGSRYFEGARVAEDIAAGNAALSALMDGMGGFRPKRLIMLRGNHEQRLLRFLEENPRLIGVLGEDQLADRDYGWEVFPFLQPVEIGGVTYAHYFYNPNNGRPYSGSIETMLRNIGFSFTMGHQQGLRWGRRELTNGHVQIGLVAGSCYPHSEHYRGPQAKSEWRGVVVKHEVRNGNYDPMFASLDFLMRRFGGDS